MRTPWGLHGNPWGTVKYRKSLADIVAGVLNSDPSWLTYSFSDLHKSLCTLSRDEVRTVASRISPLFSEGRHYDKLSCIKHILEDFETRSSFLSSCSTPAIYTYVHEENLSVSTNLPRHVDTLAVSILMEYNTNIYQLPEMRLRVRVGE